MYLHCTVYHIYKHPTLGLSEALNENIHYYYDKPLNVFSIWLFPYLLFTCTLNWFNTNTGPFILKHPLFGSNTPFWHTLSCCIDWRSQYITTLLFCSTTCIFSFFICIPNWPNTACIIACSRTRTLRHDYYGQISLHKHPQCPTLHEVSYSLIQDVYLSSFWY